MRTLRLLFWLRWTLFLRGHSVSNRIAAFVLPALFAVAFAPFYLGGAVLAFAGVLKLGAPVAIVALGACQVAWLYMGLLLGAMGRSFDLDRLLRYPLCPSQVYAVNVLAACIEPVCLMTLPTVFALAAGAFVRSGLVAGLATLVAGLLVILVTSALLQLLLAVLDELLRREWVRYVALSLFSLTFVALQVVLRGVSRGLVERLTHPGVTSEELVGFAATAIAKLPTVGWPAALATGALDGAPLRALLGLAGTAALFALLLAPGAALMRHTARAGESAGGGPAKRESSKGSVAFPLPGLPRTLALLLAREVRYTLQSPQRLVSIVLTPLVLVFLSLGRTGSAIAQPAFVVILLGSTVTTAAITQFSFDGPGVRQFFLLPCAPRDVVLAKNLEFFLRVAVQLVLIYVPLSLMARTGWTSLGLTVFTGATAVVFACAALGSYVSIRWPVRARRRGLSTRGDGGWGGLAMLAGTVAFAALVGGTVWAARTVAGPAYATPAGLVAAAIYLALTAGMWWVSLDRNAGALLVNREKLIETIAKIEEV
jgi:hypothetical protein